ncbi:MAG TPA: Gfo/Idh/MocA family oxidoreductase [Candidatus Limnocylindria bacterium]|jgi:predicted dehydrogenase|nr:Gfo/Idh/MocA family oxidoreductase [Candidatus Limnocylindria bacterium]
MPLRIGILGTGFAGAMHARSARGLSDVSVVAIAAATREEAAPLAAECGARIEDSAASLCAADDVDLVVVATPTYLHSEHAVAAARAGKHVFCEKPIARELSEAKEMIAACEEAGVRLAVGHVVRFFPEYRRAKELLDDGTLGRPAMVTLTRGNFSVGSARAWYLDPRKSGGVVLDLMLHDLDTLRWWFGEPSRVYGRWLRASEGLEYALATIRYDDRPIVHVEASWAEHAGFRTGFEIRGDRGMLTHDSRAVAPLTLQSPAAENAPAMMAAPTLAESPYRAQLRDLRDRLLRGEPPLVDGREGLRSLALGLAVIESARSGEVVTSGTPA